MNSLFFAVTLPLIGVFLMIYSYATGVVFIGDVGLGFVLSGCFLGLLYFRKKAKQHELHPEADCIRASDAWSEHPQFPRDDWRLEAAANDTQLGYWEWVSHQLETRDQFTEVK